jgi:3-oxoacyl-(acyl-carrier-protein) synthase
MLQALDYRGNHLYAVEPPYDRWMSDIELQRIPRLIKMAVATSRMTLEEAGVHIPHAIVLGTGFGMVTESESAIHDLITKKTTDGLAHIQQEALAYHIAHHLKCNGYNTTFMHEGLSFESALLNALALLKENKDWKILVGGFDEYSETSNVILTRMNLLRRKIASTLQLFKPLKPGTIQGEGCAFFSVSEALHEHSQAELVNLRMIDNPTPQKLQDFVEVFIRDNGYTPGEIDFVLSGRNGDKRKDPTLEEVTKKILRATPSGVYKHLCGEYATASAFGLWLAVRILKERHVPEVVALSHINRPINTLLLVNTYFHRSYSVMLLRACRKKL